MLAVLIIFPGFKSAFSDVIGYYWVSYSANKLVTEILIDIGIIGTILIALLAFRSSLAAFKIKKTNLFFLILPFILIGQFFIINCIDIFLIYLFLIPTIYKRIIG